MELCIEVYNSIPPHLYTFIPPLTQTGKPPGKTKRDLKGLGDPRFLSHLRPYFGKQSEIMALIFTFRNQTVLRRFSEPESGNQSPIWASFLS